MPKKNPRCRRLPCLPLLTTKTTNKNDQQQENNAMLKKSNKATGKKKKKTSSSSSLKIRWAVVKETNEQQQRVLLLMYKNQHQTTLSRCIFIMYTNGDAFSPPFSMNEKQTNKPLMFCEYFFLSSPPLALPPPTHSFACE